MFSLAGRQVTITGGAGGLGSAIATACASQGAKIAIADLDLSSASTLADRLDTEHGPGTCHAVEMDVTNEASVISAYEQIREAQKSIDVVVATAGIGELCPIAEMRYEQWRQMLAIHLDGTFLAFRHALPDMLTAGHGRLVGFSSVAALQGVARQAHYAAAKGGIDGLVRALAREVAGAGVTVNAIAPGYFETSLNDLAPPGRLDALLEHIPAGRFGEPSEIGALAVYLCSDEAAYLTGQTISPNGGFQYSSQTGD
jgi:2-hydroxycyclohexanecarboxyl-CoA dehydrogenase